MTERDGIFLMLCLWITNTVYFVALLIEVRELRKKLK